MCAYVYIYTHTYIFMCVYWLVYCLFKLGSWIVRIYMFLLMLFSLHVSLFPLQFICCKTGSSVLYNFPQFGFCCHLNYFSVPYISCRLVVRSRGLISFRFEIHTQMLFQQVHFIDHGMWYVSIRRPFIAGCLLFCGVDSHWLLSRFIISLEVTRW